MSEADINGVQTDTLRPLRHSFLNKAAHFAICGGASSGRRAANPALLLTIQKAAIVAEATGWRVNGSAPISDAPLQRRILIAKNSAVSFFPVVTTALGRGERIADRWLKRTHIRDDQACRAGRHAVEPGASGQRDIEERQSAGEGGVFLENPDIAQAIADSLQECRRALEGSASRLSDRRTHPYLDLRDVRFCHPVLSRLSQDDAVRDAVPHARRTLGCDQLQRRERIRHLVHRAQSARHDGPRAVSFHPRCRSEYT